MRLSQSVFIGAWLLIGLNLLMAFASIWVFMRMSPAIEIIIDRNEMSLFACEEMLASLAMVDGSESGVGGPKAAFLAALERAENNITEPDEPAAIDVIKERYIKALEGGRAELKGTVDAILHLGAINRAAMLAADKKARQFGSAGAWGIVFMASVVFLVGILFLRSLERHLSNPMEEIHAVAAAVRSGDTLRRCTGTRLPKEVRQVFNDVNDIMDRSSGTPLVK